MSEQQKYQQIIKKIKSTKQYIVKSKLKKGKISLVLKPKNDIIIKDKVIDEFINEQILELRNTIKFLNGLLK